MRPRGLQKAPNDGPEASGGRLLSPRRVMLRLVELLGAIRDLQECSRESQGPSGERSGSSRGVLGALWRRLGVLWIAFGSILGDKMELGSGIVAFSRIELPSTREHRF